MIQHLKELEFMYRNASVQIPNEIFKELASAIKNSKQQNNIQQASFAYAYLTVNAFLYKYTHYVDPVHDRYIQNSDLKELLGYNKTSKSIDRIISKNGILENLGLVNTTKDYPVRFFVDDKTSDEEYPKREFIHMSELTSDDILFESYKKTVKNRNYEVREPLFIVGSDERVSTLTDFSSTHKVTIREVIQFIEDKELSNIDFIIYAYIKSKCQGRKGYIKSIALKSITPELGIDLNTFYRHLDILKKKKYLSVAHGKWKMRIADKNVKMISNQYQWRGVS